MNNGKIVRRMLGVSLILSMLARCTGTPEEPPLEDTAWVLTSLNSNSLIEGTRITLYFADGFVSGSAGCNAYRPLFVGSDNRTYRYRATNEGALTIPGFVITEKDCPTPQGIMQQEQAYVEALRKAATYRMIGDRLEIDNAAGKTTLVFTSEPQ